MEMSKPPIIELYFINFIFEFILLSYMIKYIRNRMLDTQ